MTNSIKSITKLFAKFFSIVLVAGLLASCTSVADSGFEDLESQEETTVSTDSPEVDPMAGDEMDPIITDGPGTGGR